MAGNAFSLRAVFLNRTLKPSPRPSGIQAPAEALAARPVPAPAG